MEVTLGGDRLGSGNKQKVELHNYHMSSFNQEQDFKSTMAPGVLYPFLKLIGTNHGTFDINLDHFIRTLPTVGPLFGSFKFQADLFCVPIRLYQGILHNNPIDIGLKMNQVYLPKIELKTMDGSWTKIPKVNGSNKNNYQISNSALLKYLGLSGIGTGIPVTGQQTVEIKRKFNAVPVLAYYDIFKNYYANKQEEYAYVITPGDIQTIQTGSITSKKYWFVGTIPDNPIVGKYKDIIENESPSLTTNNTRTTLLKFEYENIDNPLNKIVLKIGNQAGDNYEENNLYWWYLQGYLEIIYNDNNTLVLAITPDNWEQIMDEIFYDLPRSTSLYINLITVSPNTNPTTTATIQLTPFELKNIDLMRQELLSCNQIGEEFIIDQNNVGGTYPYSTLVEQTEDGITYNAFKQNGLVVKTYQSDLFNNWLSSESIDLISQMTKVNTTNGFTMDDLNFMEKAYNVLNRIAVSGGTYEDWQEAVYGEGAIRRAETPMYVGGMSAEIMFEEVIASTESNIGDEYQALGALAGKGTAVNKHGGNDIHIKCEEPCYIIGICSITPRIAYSQGNDWDLTELDSLNDLHKPGFDGIGFQDLIIEQMAWWNTIVNELGQIVERNSAGKQTAWINYQTAVDKVYGDFAELEKAGYMVLNRNYEQGENRGEVKDITTYIDPAKYNYAFAYTNLDAQNFWVQIHSKVIARRKMAATQIPNL